MKQCIVCKGTRFNIKINELHLPEEERTYRYGDCCCLVCAINYNEIMIKKEPKKTETVIIIDSSGNKYSGKIYR